MKKPFIAICFVFLCIGAAAQADIDVLHYKFDIALDDNTDTIRGKATIHFRFLHRAGTVVLDLKAPDKRGRGMTASTFSATGKPLAGKQFPDQLEITLPKEARVGDTMTLVVEYKGLPADGLIISKNKFGKRSFFADNWPNRGHHWLPCHDDPADKASVEFVVTAPQQYQVVANGIQQEETNLPGTKKRTHWKEEVPISTKVMVIGVSDFAVSLSGVIDGCIPVYSWVYPEDRDKGFFDYAQATEILPWFIKHVGPYGYKKLANVQSKTTFGGLENANTIFYSESSVSGTRKSESLLTHEIAHQWFGNMATEKTFAHLWLSEGFATYMTILYMENKYGKDTAVYMLKEDRQQVADFARNSNRSVVDQTKDYMALLNANSYQKGGWVLHMLRQELGDSIFWKGIRKYYSTYAGKTADTDDFRKVLEEVSGKNLALFFQQWLFTAGIPRLNISWQYAEKEKAIAVTVTQQQSNLFQFPLTLQVRVAGKEQFEKITITRQTETFLIPVKGKVTGINPDPHTALLAVWQP